MLISLIGGDSRFIYTAAKLKDLGHTVLWTLNGETEATLEQATAADAIVLPTPVSRDGVTLNAPLCEKSINLCDLISKLDDNKIILGGITKIDRKNYCDYYNNQAFLHKNSAITAEGAINAAIENTSHSLYGSRVLVVGYGNLGKALCKRLISFECRLCASARKHSDFEQICNLGINCANTLELNDIINEFDVIFNTVPYRVLGKDVLQNAKKDALFIELASAPYGIDLDYAKEHNLKTLVLPALPSRCAPKSAGEIIAETINDLIVKKG